MDDVAAATAAAAEYRTLHREAMSSQTGSSLLDIYATLSTLPVHLMLFAWTSAVRPGDDRSFRSFCVEFAAVVLPVVFNMTVFAEYPAAQLAFYSVASAFPVAWLVASDRDAARDVPTRRSPYVTIYRFTVNAYTAFCILAVDFRAFPRRFAKTETYGHSVMDIGVGCYVCSSALLLRDDDDGGGGTGTRRALAAFRQAWPLLALGVGRAFFVTAADYHHYVFEYGVHWNFFVTLALLKIVNLFALPALVGGGRGARRLFAAATALVLAYELSLNAGLAEWIASDAPRDTLFAANREGVLSLIGYEALFLYSLCVKRLVSAVLKKRHVLINDLVPVAVVGSLTVALFLLTCVISHFCGVSRRFANAGYVCWTLSISAYLLFMSMIIENLIAVVVLKTGKLKEFNRVSLIVDSVNDNLLFFFLFANVLTGVVNMCMYTLKMDTVPSLIILSLYMFTIYFTVFILQQFKKKN